MGSSRGCSARLAPGTRQACALHQGACAQSVATARPSVQRAPRVRRGQTGRPSPPSRLLAEQPPSCKWFRRTRPRPDGPASSRGRGLAVQSSAGPRKEEREALSQRGDATRAKRSRNPGERGLSHRGQLEPQAGHVGAHEGQEAGGRAAHPRAVPRPEGPTPRAGCSRRAGSQQPRPAAPEVRVSSRRHGQPCSLGPSQALWGLSGIPAPPTPCQMHPQCDNRRCLQTSHSVPCGQSRLGDSLGCKGSEERAPPRGRAPPAWGRPSSYEL